MKLEIKQTDNTTSLYDGDLEVCKFVTGSRQLNEKYAREMVKPFIREESPEDKRIVNYEHICAGTNCKYYKVWDYGYQNCYSCTKLGQSYNVNLYPSVCPFLDEMHKEDPDRGDEINLEEDLK